MTRKILVSVIAFAIIALLLLSLRQARIVQVNRMNRAWHTLQQEKVRWQRVRMQLAAVARPGLFQPTPDQETWQSAVGKPEPIDVQQTIEANIVQGDLQPRPDRTP